MFYSATLEALHMEWRTIEHISKFEYYYSGITSLYSEKLQTNSLYWEKLQRADDNCINLHLDTHANTSEKCYHNDAHIFTPIETRNWGFGGILSRKI